MDIYSRRTGMHWMVQRHSPKVLTFSQRTQRPGNSILAAHHHPRYSTEQSEELSSPGVLLGKTRQTAVKNHSSLHSPGQLTAQPPATSFLCLVFLPQTSGARSQQPIKTSCAGFQQLIPAPCLQPPVGISVKARAVIRDLLGPNLNSGRSFRQVIQYIAIPSVI